MRIHRKPNPLRVGEWPTVPHKERKPVRKISRWRARLATEWFLLQRMYHEIPYIMEEERDAIVSRLISFLGLATDSRGETLHIGDRVRILCQEHDGRGLPAAVYDNLNPCAHSGPSPQIIAMRPSFLVASSAYLVLLDIG